MADYKKTALALKLQYPKDYVSFSRGYSASHKGVDMAWNASYGGANAPIYAPADGEVVGVVNTKGNTWAKGVGDWGNYVKIKHATGVYTLSAHMKKGSIVVKKGQKVVRGQLLGLQNNSGYSNGSHDHFEVYVGGSGTSYRVDPVKYTYVYPNQTVNASTAKQYDLLHYSPIVYVGTPVQRNSKADQIRVNATTLRARTAPGLSADALGYIRTGIYDVKGTKEADGYVWYNVEKYWIANNATGTWCEFLPKAVPVFRMQLEKLSEKQRDEMVAWCKAQGVKYTLTEE